MLVSLNLPFREKRKKEQLRTKHKGSEFFGVINNENANCFVYRNYESCLAM